MFSSEDNRGSVATMVLPEPGLDLRSQQLASDFVESSVLISGDKGVFLMAFLRFRNRLNLLSLLFHFSEQPMATAVPAKRIAIGMVMRYAMTGEELSSAVTGGISSRILYCVNCARYNNYDKCDE